MSFIKISDDEFLNLDAIATFSFSEVIPAGSVKGWDSTPVQESKMKITLLDGRVIMLSGIFAAKAIAELVVR